MLSLDTYGPTPSHSPQDQDIPPPHTRTHANSTHRTHCRVNPLGPCIYRHFSSRRESNAYPQGSVLPLDGENKRDCFTSLLMHLSRSRSISIYGTEASHSPLVPFIYLLIHLSISISISIYGTWSTTLPSRSLHISVNPSIYIYNLFTAPKHHTPLAFPLYIYSSIYLYLYPYLFTAPKHHTPLAFPLYIYSSIYL